MDLIIEHRVDFDGIIGGLIIEKYLDESGLKYKTLGWNYGDDIPNVSGYDRIILTDICLPSEFMIKNKDKIIWIDHHETQITDSIKYGYDDLPGVRKNGTAACVLTWEYFFKTDIPKFIQLIGAYDIWDHYSFSWNDETLPLQYGLKNTYEMSNASIKPDFESLLSGEYVNILEDGKLILKYLSKTWSSWCKNYAFEVKVDNKYSGICMLTPQFGSSIFQSQEYDKYDIKICANKRSNNKYYVSLYTDLNLGDFSLGEYAKKISKTGVAGGHKRAAGLEVTEEQFIELFSKNVI